MRCRYEELNEKNNGENVIATKSIDLKNVTFLLLLSMSYFVGKCQLIGNERS